LGNASRKSSALSGSSASVTIFHGLRPVAFRSAGSFSKISSGEDSGPLAVEGRSSDIVEELALLTSRLPASSLMASFSDS